MTNEAHDNSERNQPLGLASTDQLGLAPERAAFERWAAQRWGAEAYRHTSGTSGEWDAWQAGVEAARSRLQMAMWETWQMIDPVRPPGTPGSYARGEHNGIAAALTTLKQNVEREYRKA